MLISELMEGGKSESHEPKGLRGNCVVLLFFLVLAIISIGGYLMFRFVLDIPSA